MGARYRRQVGLVDDGAFRELADLVYSGRSRVIRQARLRQAIGLGDRLGMTSGDAVRLATETLRALDRYGELQQAMSHVLELFDSGRLLTGVREPMNVYLERSAVSAFAVAVSEQCRPGIGVREVTPKLEDGTVEPVSVATRRGESRPERVNRRGDDIASGRFKHVAHWPERTGEGFPRMTLDVMVWWPGLQAWEEATLTATVSQSLAFAGENFTLEIEQPGDVPSARTNLVWLVAREDLQEHVYELRASSWELGEDDAHRFRFLVASPSPWCAELYDYLVARWINVGKSPTGPEEFDREALDGPPPIRPVTSPAE